MQLADLTLGLNPQAWGVAHIVAAHSLDVDNPDDFLISTSAWYNGRERGVCFSVQKIGKDVLHLVVYEHRNSDQLCALKWVGLAGVNPPTIDRDGEKAFRTDDSTGYAHQVSYGDIGEMATWVMNQMHEYAKSSETAVRKGRRPN